MPRSTRATRPSKPDPVRDPADWQNHEHVSEATQSAAQQLLESAGSADLAKHAIDVIDDEQHVAPTPHHDLATRAGFTSYLELASASTRIAATQDGQTGWFITPLPSGRWIVWNDLDLHEREFPTRDAAAATVSKLIGR